jgi:hypothetical protein
MEDIDGRKEYSSILRIAAAKESFRIYPTFINNGNINLIYSGNTKEFRLVNSYGAVVYRKPLNRGNVSIALALPPLPPGIYFAQMVGENNYSQKVIID